MPFIGKQCDCGQASLGKAQENGRSQEEQDRISLEKFFHSALETLGIEMLHAFWAIRNLESAYLTMERHSHLFKGTPPPAFEKAKQMRSRGSKK